MLGNITKRTVDAAKAGKLDTFVWDEKVRGFGVKITPKGKKVYVLQYRVPGRMVPKRYTIGVHGSPWTPEKARDEAVRLQGRAKAGEDLAATRDKEKTKQTVAALCDQYLSEGCETKKSSTLATDKGRIERHIKPLLGRMFVKDVTSNDVKRFLKDVAKGKTAADIKTKSRGRARITGGKGTASRTVGLLGGIFSFAVAEGTIIHNPVRGVKRFTDKKSERFLSPAELKRLGDVLIESLDHAEKVADLERRRSESTNQAERTKLLLKIRKLSIKAESPVAVAAIRLLIFTGCRKSEILTLKWSEVDFENCCLRLSDSKTGQKIVMLGAPALEILEKLVRIEGCPYVLPGKGNNSHFVGLPKVWNRIRARAKLDDVRLHDLRHSFVSVGVGAGMGLAVIGKLVGHRDTKTTSRYAHLADDPVKAAADRISATIAAQMMGSAGDNIQAVRTPKQ